MGYAPPRRPSKSLPVSPDEDARLIARSLGAEGERFLHEDRAIAEFTWSRSQSRKQRTRSSADPTILGARSPRRVFG
jgi:hypothetical protein